MSASFDQGTKRISADQHASLAAPPRDRSISVDDFLDQTVYADPESDSDADEDDTPVTRAQKRPRSQIRRSNSSFSLESEAEDEQSAAKKPRPDPTPPTAVSTPLSSPLQPQPKAPSPTPSRSPNSDRPSSRTVSVSRSPISRVPIAATSTPSLSLLNVTGLPPRQPSLPLPLSSPKITPAPASPPILSGASPRSPNAPATPPAQSLSRNPTPAASASPEVTFVSARPAAPTAKPTPPKPTVVTSPVPNHASPTSPRPVTAVPQLPSPLTTNPTATTSNPTSPVPTKPTSQGFKLTSPVAKKPTPPAPSVNSPMQTTAQPRQPSPVHSASVHEPAQNPETPQVKPLTHDNLINLWTPKVSDGSDWDRLVFFKHRPQRYDFGKSAYISDFSPFSAVVAEVGGSSPSSVCAVCGGAYNLTPCNGCVCAFHAKCIIPYPVTTAPWYCKGCRSAGVPGNQVPPIPDPPANLIGVAKSLHRPIYEANEGNPIDLTLHPGLLKIFREQYGGHDWLQCSVCKRRRIVMKGVLSESVDIPFTCENAFWLPQNERNCHSQMDPETQRIEKFINEQAALRPTRRKALFQYDFGDGSDDEDTIIKRSPNNVKLSAKPLSRRSKTPDTHVPNGVPVPAQTTPSEPTPDPMQISDNNEAGSPRIVNTTKAFDEMEVDSTAKEPQTRPSSEPVVNGNSQLTGEGHQSHVTEQATPSVTQSAATTAQAKTHHQKQEDSFGGSVPGADDIQQELLGYIAELELDEVTEDTLTDLALSNNKALTQIFIAFRANKERFKRQAKRIARRMSDKA